MIGGGILIFHETIRLLSCQGLPSFHNVTREVKEAVARSGIQNGIVTVYSHHTTCSVTIQEDAFDTSMTGLDYLQMDLIEALELIAPSQRKEGFYMHPGPKALAFAQKHNEDARGCHNTDAHLRSAIMGHSETICLIDGEVDLGEFGFIYFIDFDQTRARERKVQIAIIGE